MPILNLNFIKGVNDTLLVFIHGGGYTLNTWDLVLNELYQICPDYSILTLDLRGHGLSFDANSFSLEEYSQDILETYISLQFKPKYTILIGHSLGAAIAIDIAYNKLITNVIGVVDVDVVEGTALNALQYMKNIIQQRPEQFTSIQEAIQWAIHSNYATEQNAALGVPHQLVKSGSTWIWRTDLLQTEPFWMNWFTNLSTKFLECTCGKLLIVANTNRLDTPLTIAQMQGKFQMTILPYGHALHEHNPLEFATVLHTFAKRQVPLVFPRKMK